ncbi:MAG: hypothetical protein QOJ64_3759 [Acidobacteriota bacterium]|jgi:hypothetical protein|nr:hypothetical protein [Acidobacteriota bacterium]
MMPGRCKERTARSRSSLIHARLQPGGTEVMATITVSTVSDFRAGEKPLKRFRLNQPYVSTRLKPGENEMGFN